jgi:ribonuclease P protein component
MAAEPGAPALDTLKKRRDFLAAARARKAPARAFLLQARDRREDPPGAPRIGYTASKKVGGAVVRNRAKRRLRALAREVLAPAARPGWDYVLIARAGETVSRSFEALRRDLADALAHAHAPSTPRRRKA